MNNKPVALMNEDRELTGSVEVRVPSPDSETGNDLVVHEVDTDGNHRINVGRYKGDWYGYDFIAVNGPYFATTSYYDGKLPELFTIYTILNHKG